MENMQEVAVTEKQEKGKVSTGKTNGLRFIQGFGFYLEKFKDQKNNRELVKKEMIEEYPKKVESVMKWLDWYKGYYNMGKIKGYNTDKSENVKWNS